MIETDRLILRHFQEGDEDSVFHNWASDPEVTKYLTWLPHESIEVTKKILGNWLKEYEDPKVERYGITLKSTGELIGAIDIAGFIDDTPAIGYCLSRKYWSQGYMSEACSAFVNRLFSIGYKKVIIEADVNNVASNRVIEKCGFVFTHQQNKLCSSFKPVMITTNWYKIEKND